MLYEICRKSHFYLSNLKNIIASHRIPNPAKGARNASSDPHVALWRRHLSPNPAPLVPHYLGIVFSAYLTYTTGPHPSKFLDTLLFGNILLHSIP